MTNSYTQGPKEKRLYQQALTGDPISSATWKVWQSDPSGVGNAVVGTPLTSGTTTMAMISGLKAGVTYAGNVHIVGTSGQEYDVDFEIVCKK